MFKCQHCKRQTQPGEKATKVPIKIRRVNYPNGGNGFETEYEFQLCPDCVAIANGARNMGLRIASA